MDEQKQNTYDEILGSEYHNQPVRISAIITGKTLTPYHIPKTIKVQCMSTRKCLGCPIKDEVIYTVDARDQNILRYIDIPTAKMVSITTDIMGLRCNNLLHEVLDVQLVERVYIARPTGKERTRKGGGARPAYLIGQSVEPNNVYALEGYTTIDPTSQSVTQVFTNAKKQKNDVESFTLTAKKHTELSQFCLDTNDPKVMFAKLVEIYTNYSHNITKIYERFDLHMCVDLLFRSVLSFRFDNEFVHKGWLDAMIIGDTRCGKGYVAEKLMDYFGLGEVVSGENASFAGLVGGLQQLQERWVITWGKIPMNDCGLLVIDETSGLEDNMFGKLSRIRSEGVAEITKIQTEISNARTRLLFLCNPDNRMITSYSYGIQSIQDLIKAPEDIARFDYVLVVAQNEVSGKVINQRRDPLPKMYDEQLEQDLILWCWSRKPSEVQFSKEAIAAIYKTSMKLETIYDFSIPLIQVENVRFKLAKIAIAFAARFYSNAQNGKILLVKSCHVEAAFVFFDIIYGKDPSGYRAYSMMKKSSNEIVTPEKLDEIETYFDKWKLQRTELQRYLLTNNSIDPDGIVVHLGASKDQAIECMSRLLKAGCLTKRGKFYFKTSDFNQWLKNRLFKKEVKDE